MRNEISALAVKKIALFILPLLLVVLFVGCTVDNDSISIDNEKTDKAIEDATTETSDILQVDDEGNTKINAVALGNYLEQTKVLELSAEEITGIKFMLEEEKLARDVYVKFYEKWNQPIFDNISQSEETHKDAVRDLAKKFGVDIEFYNDEVGKFDNKELLGLYNDLVASGENSLLEALSMGALIEEIDILDLDKFLEQTSSGDISLVYNNLLKGSRNHLRSFVRNMTKQGYKYEPQKLSTINYERIINSENERGGSKQSGGQRNGSAGKGQERKD